jgi:hypothetical protein
LTIRQMLARDWDCAIAIDGFEGSGKSDLAMNLGKRVDPGFKIDRDHIVYRYGDLIDKIYKLPKRSVIQHDEFGISALNREAMTKANRDLVKAMMVCRDQNQCLLLCVPSIWALDPYVRNHRLRYWFHIADKEYRGLPVRGYVEIRKAKPNTWGDEPYWRLLGIIHTNPIPDDIYQAYKKLKREAILEQLKDGDSPRTALSLESRNASMKEARARGLTERRIADYWDLSQPTVHQIVSSID